jgi:hypothetical protein
MDPRLHQLQGKAKHVNATQRLELLREFYTDKLAMLRRHQVSARYVSDYDFNNTYQYVIAREEMHVSWVRDAILDVSEQTNAPSAGQADEAPEPAIQVSGKGAEAERVVMAQDRDGAQAFIDKWRPRVAQMTHARHRTMLNVILGETLEHKRFFDQATGGRTDLLGRRPEGSGTGGGVLPVRWIEQ